MVLVLLVGTLPVVAAAQRQAIPGNCEAAYNAQFAVWITYLNGGQDEPEPPDRDADCFDARLQAQVDAVTAWARSATRDATVSTPVPAELPPFPYGQAPSGDSAAARPTSTPTNYQLALQQLQPDMPSALAQPPTLLPTSVPPGPASSPPAPLVQS